jgi:hypothetical protein
LEDYGEVPVLTDKEIELNIHGRVIDHTICPDTPPSIRFFASRQLKWMTDSKPRVHMPEHGPGTFVPHLPQDYRHRVEDMRKLRNENPYVWHKDVTLERHFWTKF